MEQGHDPIVNALVKACGRRKGQWPNLLPLALLANKTITGSVTSVAPVELINGCLLLMPIEGEVTSWRIVSWRDEVSREELLQRRIVIVFSDT